MIGQNHEGKSRGVLPWVTLVLAIALGILLMFFVPVIPPPSGPASMDLFKPRIIEIR
jgi:hypothetical protein